MYDNSDFVLLLNNHLPALVRRSIVRIVFGDVRINTRECQLLVMGLRDSLNDELSVGEWRFGFVLFARRPSFARYVRRRRQVVHGRRTQADRTVGVDLYPPGRRTPSSGRGVPSRARSGGGAGRAMAVVRRVHHGVVGHVTQVRFRLVGVRREGRSNRLLVLLQLDWEADVGRGVDDGVVGHGCGGVHSIAEAERVDANGAVAQSAVRVVVQAAAGTSRTGVGNADGPSGRVGGRSVVIIFRLGNIDAERLDVQLAGRRRQLHRLHQVRVVHQRLEKQTDAGAGKAD